MRRVIVSLCMIVSAVVCVVDESGAASYEAWSKGPLSKFGSYNRAKISRDGRYITAADASHYQDILFFKAGSSEPIWQCAPATHANLDLALSDNGEYLAASGSHIVFFDKSSSKPLWSYVPQSPSHFESADVSRDGSYIAACGMKISDNQGKLLLFGKDKPQPLMEWDVQGTAYQVNISSDGACIATGTDEVVAFFNADKPSMAWQYVLRPGPSGTRDKVKRMSMCDSGKYFAATTYYGILYVFDRDKTDGPLWQKQFKSKPDLDVAMSADGSHLVAAVYGEYYGFNTTSSDDVWSTNWGGYFADTALSADGKFVCIADSNAHRIYFLDWKYLTMRDNKPFRVYHGVFPSSISIDDEAARVVYDEKQLQYREVPPGVFVRRKDMLPLYQAGSICNLSAFISNPGRENILRLKAFVTILPHEAMMNDAMKSANEDEGVVSKVREIPETGVGNAVVVDMPVVVDKHSSKEFDIAFKFPPMLVPKSEKDFVKFMDGLKEKARVCRRYIKGRLPKEVADSIDEQFLRPAEKEYQEQIEKAKQSAMKNLQPDTGISVPVFMMGFGDVSIYDQKTDEFLDKDTFFFIYQLSTNDLAPEL